MITLDLQSYTILFNETVKDDIKVLYKRLDGIDEDITEDVVNDFTKELIQFAVKKDCEIKDYWTNPDSITILKNIKEASYLTVPNLGDSIGKWKISSDGYYPYCPYCNYEPAKYVRLNKKLPSVCLNCNADMR
jgi:hypothetical protein